MCHVFQNAVMLLDRYGWRKFSGRWNPSNRALPRAMSL